MMEKIPKNPSSFGKKLKKWLEIPGPIGILKNDTAPSTKN
jgi:hypothetical protein